MADLAEKPIVFLNLSSELPTERTAEGDVILSDRLGRFNETREIRHRKFIEGLRELEKRDPLTRSIMKELAERDRNYYQRPFLLLGIWQPDPVGFRKEAYDFALGERGYRFVHSGREGQIEFPRISYSEDKLAPQLEDRKVYLTYYPSMEEIKERLRQFIEKLTSDEDPHDLSAAEIKR